MAEGSNYNGFEFAGQRPLSIPAFACGSAIVTDKKLIIVSLRLANGRRHPRFQPID
jgi:hypothetical protein